MLEQYEKKRDFRRTPEPAPQERSSSQNALTFVVQKHAARRLHYDFRLELDGVLKSWAVPKGPSLNPADKRLAVMVEDHPLDYAAFEGVIPKGQYGAGQVIVWDRGTYSPEEAGTTWFQQREAAEEQARQGLAKGKLSIVLQGQKLHGAWALVKSRRGENEWLLIKHNDGFADTSHAVDDEVESVVSGQTIDDLKANGAASAALGESPQIDPSKIAGARKAPFPADMAPMLPHLTAAPFSHPDWLFEPKLDGVRCISLIRKGDVRLLSRRGLDSTRGFPIVTHELSQAREHEMVIDGEIVALDEMGRPSFHRIAHRLHLASGSDIARADIEIPVVYYAFDLLYLDGYDLRRVPIEERKRVLREVLTPSDHVRLLDHFEAIGEIAYGSVIEHGFEGLVAKRLGSIYESGRRGHQWLKMKATTSDDFVIGGYSEGAGARAGTFGALLVGSYQDDGTLRYVVNVGTGFDDSMLAEMLARLESLRTDKCPFVPPPPDRGKVWWVRPELVAEIKFSEWTPDGSLRAPVFLSLRDDKSAEEATTSEIVPAPTEDGDVEDAVTRALKDAEEEALGSGGDHGSSFASPSGRGRLSARERAQPGEGVSRADRDGHDQGHALTLTLSQRERGQDDLLPSVLAQIDQPGKSLLLEVGDEQIGLTNLDKALWPAVGERRALTKRDLIRYFAQVSPYLLPHLQDRPLTLIRLPNGIGGQRFFQKHSETIPPFVETVRHFSKSNSGDLDYLLCNNLQTLLWIGQIAGLELHSSYCRVNPEPDGHHIPADFEGSRDSYLSSLLNYPDFVVFDLDPYIYSGLESKGAEPELNERAFGVTCEAALWLKELLDGLQLPAYVKTTGRTGLHIFVPILRQFDADTIRSAAEAVVTYLVRKHPKEITIEWSVPKRTGKIFADFNQNARGRTLASIFSPRAAPEASVSMPLRWRELADGIYPTDFTILTAPDRLVRVGDLWADILTAKHDLSAMLAG
ncbi:MAG: ligase [Chloroflexi bacterium]|nr:ligase [Chloroflexota bacterium]